MDGCKYCPSSLHSYSQDCLLNQDIILAHVEGLLRRDYLVFPHYRYYVREMRILAYTQLLESYRSLTLQYMAEAFGVTVEYIDQ